MHLHTVRSHRRTLPRPLKNKWLTASVGVATAGLLAVGIVAAPSVFATDTAKVTLARYNTATTVPSGSAITLAGTVRTPEGKPVPGATVSLMRTMANGHYGSLNTVKADSNGNASWHFVPSGSAYYALYYYGGEVAGTEKPAPPAQTQQPDPKPSTDPSADPSSSASSDQGTAGTNNTSTNNAGTNSNAGSNNSNVSNTTTSHTYAASISAGIPVYVAARGAQVVATAAQYRGKPYRYGAAGPNSFDCSGFTQFIYKKFGKSLPHSATSQARYGQAISRSAMKPGDLLLFGKPGSYYHAAIYGGGNTMWDAPTSGQTVGSHKIWSNNYTVRRLVV
jgi:cell wall-associated NlpC family hydrolase